jgi:signal transduction histidine kinase
MATIAVSDRGNGVAASERERIFSPFFRASSDGASSGTGLGLTVVRQIARQHGGEALWVGTTERPSRIRVVLPIERA